MNRQYIGARYVPVYFNNNGSPNWVEGISYEPLTIVKYLDRTYTSTKPVPSNIGAPNVNTEYWVESGDTQTINNLINAIEDVDTKVNNHVRKATEKFGQLDGKIDVVKEDIVDIKGRISLGRKYLFVGDSYALMNGGGWLTPLVTLMGLTSDNYYTACISGSAFTSQTPSTKWENMVADVVSGLTDIEKKNITDVVCIGGINDSLPYTEFPNCSNDNQALLYIVNCINDFANYVKSNLPNAKISLFYVGNTEEGMDEQGQRYYNNIVRTVCGWQNASKKNLTCYKGSENILHNYSLMSSDGIHPNADGNTMIARFVNNCLLGGVGIDIIDGFNPITIGSTTGGAPRGIYTNGTLQYTIINNMVKLALNGNLTCEMDNVTHYTEGDTIVIGKFSNTNTIHGKKVEAEVNAWYIHTTMSDAIKMPYATLIIDKGILSLKIWKLKNDWSQTSSDTMKWLILSIPNIVYPLIQN